MKALKLAAKRGKVSSFTPSEVRALSWDLLSGPLPSASSAGPSRALPGVLFGAGVAVAGIAALTAGYLSTLGGWLPVDGDGRVLVDRGGQPVDQIAAGTQIVATADSAAARDLVGRALSNVSLPDAVRVEVIAGPGGTIRDGQWKSPLTGPGRVPVPSTAANGTVEPDVYVTVCLAGDCVPGDVIMVPVTGVAGFVR